MLFPQSINEYIPQDAPVRAYDAFVDALDFEELGIEMDAHKVGCPQYDPKAVLKLLLSECDAADEQEEGQPSLVKMEERLKDAETLKTKVKDILQKLQAEDVRSLNSTDPE